MAAFSHHQHQPFLLDSAFLISNTNKTMSGFMEEVNWFSQFHPHEVVLNNDQSSCLHNQSCSNKVGAISDNEASVVKKQATEYSSTVVDNSKLESGDQVTQVVSSVENKRKNVNTAVSSSNSAQSEDASWEGKSKKQKMKVKMSNVCEKKEEKKKNKKKVPEEPPTGYIHVRARRGQATDSHSLAERVRREKISERMKMLQKLVPGCDKVTGKAQTLDEIINYVQSLQNQVEFLSMKLASFNPLFYDFGVDLEAFMIKPERLNNMESLLPFLEQQNCSPSPTHMTTGFVDATTTATTTATTNTNTLAIATTYPPLISSTSSLLLQGQRPSTDFIDQNSNGSLLWDVEDQRQKLLNPNWFTTTNNNLCSFH